MTKIVTVVGARPQFIKAAALSREIAKHEQIQEIIIHTGQHYDANMSDIFFEQMQIPQPDYNLAIHGLSHGAMTGQMLEKIETVLINEKPEWVLVYGDTNSTLAGALAAKKLHIKVAHIEAGLRSFNMKMPEEINRILTDRISDVLFCPTEASIDNLRQEGYDAKSSSIVHSGDIMYDAALYYAQFSNKYSTIISDNKLENSTFILSTLHRQENTDDPIRLRQIVDAFNELHKIHPVVLPLHPRTRKAIESMGLKLNIQVIDPVGYLDMIELLKHCKIVITDSGGLQKEAYFFQKPCLTLRDETEWVELVEAGVNTLCNAVTDIIISKALSLFNNSLIKKNQKLYGNGNASQIIIETLLKAARSS